jgi:hypothetical protein
MVGLAGWALTFGAVSLGWIFFRANTLGEALSMWKAVFTPTSYLHLTLRPNYYIVTALLACGYFFWVGGKALVGSLSDRMTAVRQGRWVLSPLVYTASILAIIAWSGSGSPFVYFQF